ncbi:uncharacterized protein LOC116196671 [Punica granatum]|uniref:Ribosomal protein L34Ae n=2 Tax=Punica granatum TaxID=22663 RepID=A0A218WA38_PUNGR|nr:uncharacterized protein LOC116196671 [Punica granatum]OWM69747.1 hypothetical protein CDL15_Pgr025596 [Punica granatum]PKI37713.1 hypothetical protein CRG98_041891 [Punica granatum]
MGAPKRAPFNNHRFSLIGMGYRNGAVLRSFVLLAAYLSALFVPLFRAVNKLFFRCEEVENPLRNLDGNRESVSSSGVAVEEEKDKTSMCAAPVEAEEPQPHTVDCSVSDSVLDKLDETESPKLFFSFKFPTFEEFARNNQVEDNSDVVSRDTSAEEKEFLSCSTKELSSEPNDRSSDESIVLETEISAEEVPAKPRNYHRSEKKEADPLGEYKAFEEGLLKELKGHLFFDKIAPRQFRVLSEKDLLMSDSDTDSMSSSHDFSIMSRLLDSNSDGFLSDGDFEGDFGLNNTRDSDEDEDLRKELGKLEESEKEVRREESNHKREGEREEEEDAEAPNSDNHGSENSTSNSSENEDSKLEAEWEHQDLIEQLRMEIRKVKATGLPTIAEDSESPRITDDLKPWKIDERPHRGDRMSELHKVYKSYRERMRKFDILNYQKMYALGFLQTKDPFKSISSQKSSAQSLATLLSQTLRPCREKSKKSEDDPMMKFARELHGDLETVYVGQMCLSWEFLQWQYEKALELWEADPYNLRQYNEVANEFQQLQVLMQRFLEHEQFEGPRVQYYVKSRCLMRNLLQVPVIREDNLKARKKSRLEGKSEFGVSSDVLVEILEESIRIFWRFIRADKDANSLLHKDRKADQPELQDPADSELFSVVQTTLQKKEKKLKEVLKGGNCILRKLKRHHRDEEDGSSSDQVLAFFSQVDMKLVRRVLSMSRLSADQLAWCNGKLSSINFVHRRIHVEPSFLLFPC